MVNRELTQPVLERAPQLSTFVDLLDWRTQQTPDRTLYRFLLDGTPNTAEVITYGQFQQRARAIAVLLRDLGCQEQPVLLLYPAGLDYIAAFFGCLYAGAIAVPAYPPRPNRSLDRIEAMVQDAGATVALTDSPTLQKLERRLGESVGLRSLYCLSTDGLQPELAQQWQPPAIQARTLALLQYTSGSTALPKGVMISHDNLLHNSELISRCFGNTADSRGVSWLPPYHDMGLVGGILQPLYVGAEMTLMPPVAFLQRPLRWLEAISHYRATTSGGPNFAYDLCVQKTTPEQRQTLDLSRWQLAFTGAEPIQQATLAQFAEAFAPCGFQPGAFYPCYGMAETTLLVTGDSAHPEPQHLTLKASDLQNNRVTPVAPSDADAARPIVGCGQPAIPDQVCIVNPDSHQLCPPNTIGEIWVRQSRSIAQGYWRRDDATQATFQATLADGESGSFLRTGDLGFFRGDDLYVTGRLKDLIIIRGRNHYPQDIEATAEQAHASLRPGGGAAFSVAGADTEDLVIVHELERTALRNADPEAVVMALRRAIAAAHDLPVGAIVLLKPNAMPKTSSGKVQRHLCRSMFLAGEFEVVYEWAMTAADWGVGGDGEEGEEGEVATVEQGGRELGGAVSLGVGLDTPAAIADWMVTWLAQTLNVPKSTLDIRQPLADYGLDSLAAVELAQALETALGISLSPTLAYEYPTIEALSVYLASALGQDPEALPQEDAVSSGKVDPGELEQLVRELELLSDAEVRNLLSRQAYY